MHERFSPRNKKKGFVLETRGVGVRRNTEAVLVSKSLTKPATQPRAADIHEGFSARKNNKSVAVTDKSVKNSDLCSHYNKDAFRGIMTVNGQ